MPCLGRLVGIRHIFRVQCERAHLDARQAGQGDGQRGSLLHLHHRGLFVVAPALRSQMSNISHQSTKQQ
eukprot:scaffold2535_cov336-Prasinococcus_capsulatus_cf.AAC.9